MRELELIIKRWFDITAAIVLIVLLTIIPVLIVIPIVIKLTSEGPAVFCQERVGKDGKRFRIYKFRTMSNPPKGTYSLNGILYKADGQLLEPSSDRITKVGTFLRRTSLDELMQLFNVLNGTMSFVGPRPTLPYQAEAYSQEQRRRFEMRPGITGFAQIHGRNDLSWTEKIEYDVKYIDGFSLGMDLKILFRTITVVLKGNQIEFKREDMLTAKK